MIGTSSTRAGRIWKLSSVFTSRLTVHRAGTDATGAAVRAFGMCKPGIHETTIIHRFPPSRFTNSESAKREFGKRNLGKREKAGRDRRARGFPRNFSVSNLRNLRTPSSVVSPPWLIGGFSKKKAKSLDIVWLLELTSTSRFQKPSDEKANSPFR